MAFFGSNDYQLCNYIDQMSNQEEGFMNSQSRYESESDEHSPDQSPAELPPTAPSKKKKVYLRCTPAQIKRMQEVFDKKPHPSELERRALARELALHPDRVKFWFQNRRSQTKKNNGKQENARLREENEKLRAENEIMTLNLTAARCKDCACHTPSETSACRAEALRAENKIIKNKVSMVTNFLETYCIGNKPLAFPVEPGAESATGPSDLRFAAIGVEPAGIAGEVLGLN